MSINNKKADTISYEFFVRLVFAIILVLTAIFMVKSFFNLSSQAESSFDELSEIISNIKDGELQSFPLIMDDNTVILMFNKGSNEINFDSASDPLTNLVTHPFKFIRPDSCPTDSACICLCASGNTLQDPEANTGSFTCEKSICKSTEKEIFYRESLISALPASTELSMTTKHFKKGILIQRGVFSEKQEGYKKPRTFTVYVKQLGKLTGVCETSPCLPEPSVLPPVES